MRIIVAVLSLLAAAAPGSAATDVGVDTILVPDGDVVGFRWITPAARCHNYGTDTAAFTAWLSLKDTSSAPIYQESLRVECLAPGAETTLAFPNWPVRGGSGSVWLAICSTYAASDGNDVNDVRRKRFEIGPPCI